MLKFKNYVSMRLGLFKMSKNVMEIANLMCKFGEIDLLDFFDTWFYPTIQDGQLKGRSNSETMYYKFIDLELLYVGDDNAPVLTGRLVKNLKIKAQQQLNEDTLEPSDDTMLSAPSSFFVLLLANHKLLWIKETSRAPQLSEFKNCLFRFLTDFRRSYLKERFNEEKAKLNLKRLKSDLREKINRQIYQEIPSLQLEVTLLSSSGVIKQNFDSYKLVRSIKIKPLTTNSEQGGLLNRLLNNISNEHSRINSSNTTMKFSNNEGLNKTESSNLLNSASDGNYHYELEARNEDDVDIKVTQNDLAIKPTVEFDRSKTNQVNADEMFNKYSNLLETGQIILPPIPLDLVSKGIEVIRKITDNNG